MKIQPSPGAIPPKSGLSMNVSPCILGLSPHSTSDVYKLHPDSRLALQLWSIYIKNVDPILKLLHIPTAQSTVVTTILDPKSAGAPMLALVFAIYFAAITTLSDQDVISLSGESPYLLLNRYKTGLNQVLVGADLLNNPELVSLQALAIFVVSHHPSLLAVLTSKTCLRVHDTSRGVWVLHGIAIRLAQSIGLHRDGTSLNLSPFETELRLRLWWHLCLLDSRAPEDHGFELTIDTLNRGPRLPLNINDSQICPNMSTLPKESDSWTEMSFSLVQIEAAKLLHPVLGTREESSTRLQDLAAKRKLIQDRTEWLKGKYFTDFDPSSQLSRAAFQHYSTACKKMEFMLQIREEMYTQQGQAPSRSEPVKTSFMGACDTLEASYALTNGEISMQFTWLFKTYTQWYALAYALRCLCANPCMAETDRAWSLVNNVLRCIGFDRSGPSDEAANSSIWRCLTTLRTQALAARKAANPPGTDTQLPHSHSIPNDVGGQHVQSQVPLQGIPIANYTAQPLPGSYSMENVAEWPQGLVPLSIPDVPCLPQWNAVVNGSLEPGLM